MEGRDASEDEQNGESPVWPIWPIWPILRRHLDEYCQSQQDGGDLMDFVVILGEIFMVFFL